MLILHAMFTAIVNQQYKEALIDYNQLPVYRSAHYKVLWTGSSSEPIIKDI